MSRQSISWYIGRLRRMSGGELAFRGRDQVLRTMWAAHQVRPGALRANHGRVADVSKPAHFATVLPGRAGADVPTEARSAIVSTADSIMNGELEVLGVQRTDLVEPDWFRCPVTGRRSDPSAYAFRINHRDETTVGNIKQVWELSRHQHLTQLAAAWYLTRDGRYAERAAAQLRSWWAENPNLSGVHWTSGIELGIRLISWTWIRRLLDGWSGVAGLFDENEAAHRQLFWHQRYLATFRSRGSSANNHVIAEAAGLLAVTCAFPWFPQSARWRARAAEVMQSELAANTFPSGMNRELATDYHRFVAELCTFSALEADAAGHSLDDATWASLTRMFDVAAALVDERIRPPRQGDDDEGHALVIDPPDPHSWASFLSLGSAVVGPAPWWPETPPDAMSVLAGAFAGQRRRIIEPPTRRPAHIDDAGVTLLRTENEAKPEIWCRCDGGPHGFLSIAAHAHADALSIELRVGGVDVLADPGTYCYHGEEEWRRYFRSTIGHNTVEIAGVDQSSPGGPFLWTRHADGRTLNVSDLVGGNQATWSAEHDGYRALDSPARHRRTVTLDRQARSVVVYDQIASPSARPVRIAFHLGPDVHADLAGNTCRLEWSTPAGPAVASAELPDDLDWSAHRGDTSPILGWYSPRFGHKVPTTTLLGTGNAVSGKPMASRFQFP